MVLNAVLLLAILSVVFLYGLMIGRHMQIKSKRIALNDRMTVLCEVNGRIHRVDDTSLRHRASNAIRIDNISSLPRGKNYNILMVKNKMIAMIVKFKAKQRQMLGIACAKVLEQIWENSGVYDNDKDRFK